MLINRYMTSVKNLPAILKKIIDGTAPEKFTVSHLKSIGFASSNDVGIVPLLKDLGFLTGDGTPTPRYLLYRDQSKSKLVMAEAIKEAYADLFHINARPTESDRQAIEGKFKSVHNVNDRIAAEQAKTFFALLKEADLDAVKEPETAGSLKKENKDTSGVSADGQINEMKKVSHTLGGFRYNIEIHLPPTKDIEVYHSIFRALKENLLDD